MGERYQPKKPEAPEGQERWNNDIFREYLLLLARKGKYGLESIDNFPKRIELNNVWHETLNKMREDTKDGHERWALIGFREDRQHLVLPRVFGVGTKTDYQRKLRARIPPEVIWREIQNAEAKTGIIGLVGDIHSHPETQSRKAVSELFGSTRITGPGGGFSAGDLYLMVIQEKFLPMAVVVEGSGNFLAFKTRESTGIPTTRRVFSQNSFEKYWYEKYGVQLEGDFAKHIPHGFSHLALNKSIAEKHNLVIYKGLAGEDLVRQYLD